MGFDKRHSASVIASAAIAANRFVNYAGAPATSATDVRGVSEYAVPVDKAVSLITAYSAQVEAAGAITALDYVKPASDGTGRVISGSVGDCCGRALGSASAAGELVEVRLLEQGFKGSSATGAAEDLLTSTGSFTFTGPAGRFVRDYNGVWFPLLANMPGFQGARAVVNWFCNSDTPGSPTAWDTFVDSGGSFSAVSDTINGAPIGALQEVNAAATAFGPYLYGFNGYWNGAWATNQPARGTIPNGTIFASRATMRSVSGATSFNIYQRNRDNNASPTESGNGPITLTGAFQTFSSTFKQCSDYRGFGVRYHPSPAAIATANVAQVQLEDLSGEKGALISSEYIGSGATPTWKWFATTRGASRTNPTMVANAAALVAQKDPVNNLTVSGILTDAPGSALSALDGVLMEPQAVNLCQGWTVPLNAGQAKTSGAMTGAAAGLAGFRAGVTTAYIEAQSGMMVDATDVALAVTTNLVTSSTTNFLLAGFNTTDTYWIWTSAAQYGPLKFSSIGANSMTSSVALATFAAGGTVRILRLPANGDNLMAECNDGSMHTTAVNAVATLPTFTGTWDIKAPITLSLAAAPAVAAGYASSDNGRSVYYWGGAADFGWTVVSGTGTFGLAYDRAQLVADNLGYVVPNGLVYKLTGATSGATVFDFGATGNGTGSRSTNAALFGRIASGAGTPTLQLKSHGAAVNLAGASYSRQAWVGSSVNTDSRLTVTIPATTPATTLYVVGMQVEQAASGETVVQSTPIVCRGVATTRTVTRCQRPWAGTAKNNITRSIRWTPMFGALAQKQVIMTIAYADANNYIELSITGTTVTMRKRRGGTNYDVTATLTPVAGTAVLFDRCGISANEGVFLTINGTPAASNGADLADITALTPAAVEDIGSNQGANVAYGAFKLLKVA